MTLVSLTVDENGEEATVAVVMKNELNELSHYSYSGSWHASVRATNQGTLTVHLDVVPTTRKKDIVDRNVPPHRFER